MVSILVPSRKRAKLLKNSLRTLGKGDFEVLVWVDDDDPQIQDYMQIPGITLFVRPRVGYKNFHKMINFLSKEASGDWLLLWNDDMRIESGQLFKEITKHNPKKPVALNFWDPTGPSNNLAPVISHAMFTAMGRHFSLSTHCDSWVQDIANELNIHKPVTGIEVTHLREVLNDETKMHTQHVYYESSPEYDNPEMQKLREKDKRSIEKWFIQNN